MTIAILWLLTPVILVIGSIGAGLVLQALSGAGKVRSRHAGSAVPQQMPQ
jgi:hypothetical protein